MSFGFKFFAGWLLGLAGFTLDIFTAVALGGLEISWLVFLNSSLTQIIGFGFMIFLAEKKVPYPKLQNFLPWIKKQSSHLKSYSQQEHLLIVLLVLATIFISITHFSITASGQNNISSFYNKVIKQFTSSEALSASLPATTQDAGPLNDALLKRWLLEVGGTVSSEDIIILTWVFYYVLLLGFFYYLLSPEIQRARRLAAVCLLAAFSSIYLNPYLSDVNLYFSIFVLMAIGSLYYFTSGKGLSFYYLAGMGLAFAIWTKNDSLIVLLPMITATTFILLLTGKVSLKNFLWQWFFTVLTITPWLWFSSINGFHLSSNNLDLRLNTLSTQFFPTIILFLTIFFAKVKLYAKQTV